MIKIKDIKKFIIKKILGGYTQEEYTHLDDRYNSILLKDLDKKSIQICNENIYEVLTQLENCAKDLYGSNEWAEKMYNIIRNNRLRLFILYLNSAKGIIYKLNTKLDKKELYIDM